MKMMYRVSIDYEVEIIERIPVLRPTRRGNPGKIQQVIDTFVSHRDILTEFNKSRLYEGLLDSDPWGNDLGPFLRVMNKKDIWYSLAQYLSPETASYFLSLVCRPKKYTGSKEEHDRETRLFFNRFGDFIPLSATFKEIWKKSGNNIHEL